MLPFVEKVELNPGTVREFKKTLPENKTVIYIYQVSMQDDIFIFTYGREYIKVRSLKVRWRLLSFGKRRYFCISSIST